MGRIGLDKKSKFLNYLPVNAHTIKIEVNEINSANNNKISIQLGQINSNIEPSKLHVSPDKEYWNLISK